MEMKETKKLDEIYEITLSKTFAVSPRGIMVPERIEANVSLTVTTASCLDIVSKLLRREREPGGGQLSS